MTLFCYREEKKKKKKKEMRSIFDIMRRRAIEQMSTQDETLSTLCIIRIIQATIDYLHS